MLVPEMRDYLCRFRINNPDVFNLLHIGYSSRSLHQYLQLNRSARGQQQRSLLKNVGIYSTKGHEHFAGCLTMAIKDVGNNITQIIGYKIKTRQRKEAKHELLLNNSSGVFNEKAAELYDEVILCNTLFSAMLFIQSGFLHVVSPYGENKYEALLDMLKKHTLKTLVVALPNNSVWSEWKEKLKILCKRKNIIYSEILLPGELDITSYYLSARNPTSCFLELIKRAKNDCMKNSDKHETIKIVGKQTTLPKENIPPSSGGGIGKHIEVSDNNKELVKYASDFIEWSAVKGHSKDTCHRRGSALARFITWCESQHIKRIQDVEAVHLQDYQRYLHHYRKKNGEPLTKGSQYTFLTPITTFFKWLKKRRYILSNPALEMELPKKPRRLPRTILNTTEVDVILEQPNLNTLEGIRDRAILETMYATGIRRCEMVALTVFDIDYHRQLLRVNDGKDEQDYLVPLGARPIKWILQYLTHVRRLYVDADDEGVLFLSRHGKPFRRGALASRVKSYMKKAGIEVKGSCHLFRHAMATHMLENGADIRYIQEMLGHANIASTQVYTKVSIEKLKEVHARTHPMMMDRSQQ